MILFSFLFQQRQFNFCIPSGHFAWYWSRKWLPYKTSISSIPNPRFADFDVYPLKLIPMALDPAILLDCRSVLGGRYSVACERHFGDVCSRQPPSSLFGACVRQDRELVRLACKMTGRRSLLVAYLCNTTRESHSWSPPQPLPSCMSFDVGAVPPSHIRSLYFGYMGLNQAAHTNLSASENLPASGFPNHPSRQDVLLKRRWALRHPTTTIRPRVRE